MTIYQRALFSAATPHAARALDLGVYRVVSKPFEMPALQELLLQAHASGLG